MQLSGYKDLVVWQKSIDLAKVIYTATNNMPRSEQYGLVSQMRRAAISIPSNIAEGSKRGTRKDFRSFLLNAYGSGAELETQIILTLELSLAKKEDYAPAIELLSEIMRMLNRMTKSLAQTTTPTKNNQAT